MFDEYNPLYNKKFQIIDNESKIINKKWFPELDQNQLIKAYKDMLFARTADLQTISYQRQGRIYTYPPNYGQEAISIAAGAVMREKDWLIPAFRKMGAYLSKGASLKEVFLYFMGNEDGSKFLKEKNILPVSVPIASQCLKGVSKGYEIVFNKKEEVVFVFSGGNSTSVGDINEACNFAGVWHVPVVFIVQNSQYGISTPVSVQTASNGIAIKAVAYGITGIQVDGNDYFAMYQVLKNASEHARNGKGPVLVEAFTCRMGTHTTSGDPSKYQAIEEVERWDKSDPLKRFKNYLIKENLWSENEEEKIISQYKNEIERQFEEAKDYHSYKHDDEFKHRYEDMPDDLKNQNIEHQKYLKWRDEGELK